MASLWGHLRSTLAKPDRTAERKASAVAPMIALQSVGRAVWTPRNYEALAKEGFARNTIVYRSIRMISEAAASLQWLAYDGKKELDVHPLLSLITKPNNLQGGPDLLESLYGHLLIAGNAYLEMVTIDGEVRELHALRPDRMKVVPGADGWPEGYEYTVNGRKTRFDTNGEGVSAILHLNLFHPVDDYYGMSPLEAAQIPVDIHNAAGAWNKALLDNAARPSGALVYAPAEKGAGLTTEQYDRLKSELENSFQGAVNAGRPLLLEGGLDWKTMSLSPRDMDFMEAKHAAARDIALAFGVPPMLLGIPGDNTYANYREANRVLWRQTVLPLANRVSKSLTNWLAPMYDGELRLAFDMERIEALAQEREAVWKRLQESDFLTVNEKRDAVGLGPIDVDDAPAAANN